MRKEVSDWFDQAKDDLEKAEILLKNNKLDGAAFYSQQAVEKALKALFIQKLARSAGHTHSLIYLAKGLGVPKEYYPLLQSLTAEFTATRYPDMVGEAPYRLYSDKKASDYVKESKELIKWIENQISKL